MSNFNLPCHNGASDFPQLSLKLCSGPLPNSCVTLILYFLNLSLHHHQVSLPKIGSLPSTFQVLYCQPNKTPVSLASAQGLPLGHFPPSHSVCLCFFSFLLEFLSAVYYLFIYSKENKCLLFVTPKAPLVSASVSLLIMLPLSEMLFPLFFFSYFYKYFLTLYRLR